MCTCVDKITGTPHAHDPALLSHMCVCQIYRLRSTVRCCSYFVQPLDVLSGETLSKEKPIIPRVDPSSVCHIQASHVIK